MHAATIAAASPPANSFLALTIQHLLKVGLRVNIVFPFFPYDLSPLSPLSRRERRSGFYVLVLSPLSPRERGLRGEVRF
jgi:hypothetical protein